MASRTASRRRGLTASGAGLSSDFLAEDVNFMEMSQSEAKIVETPGTCGGRPRLYGHRLDIVWYAQIREAHGDRTVAEINLGWPYLRDDQIRAMADFYDAHPEWHRGGW